MTTNNGKGVIFDLDGVLVDTGEFHKQSWYDLAEQQDWSLNDEFFYRTFGMQNYQIIPMLAGESLPPEEIASLSVWKEQRYRELIAGKLTLLGGVKPLLDDLTSCGFRLAIGTSTPLINLEFMLDETQVHEYFDALVASEDVTNGKPAPDTFLKAAQKLSLIPADCVVVEDAIPGVQAAKAAGMLVVAVTTTRRRADLTEADLVVDSLSELSADDFKTLLVP
jgi:beta-phosphoglucomutase